MLRIISKTCHTLHLLSQEKEFYGQDFTLNNLFRQINEQSDDIMPQHVKRKPY